MSYPTDWGRKCELSIESDKVAGDLTDFPVLLNEDTLPSEMFDADGSYFALNGGGDIRFSSDSAGVNQLPCEIVSFITDNDPANGSAEIWVKVPSVSSSTDTKIYVWYHKSGETQPAVDSTYGAENVWDSNFKMVQHMGDVTTSTITDSTTNDNDGTKKDVDKPEQITNGQISDAQDFDGSEDYIHVADDDSLSFGNGSTDTPFSVSAWVNMDSVVNFRWFCKGHWTSTAEYYFYTAASKLNFVLADNSNVGWIGRLYNTVLTAYQGNWVFITASYDGSGSDTGINIYINGVAVDDVNNSGGTYVAMENLGEELLIGANSWSANIDYFADGKIDEVRVSNVVRSDEWILAEYKNTNSPSTFITEGTPETPITGLNLQINIGDSFKDVEAIKINIGDSWKVVTAIKINIGDSWKDVF